MLNKKFKLISVKCEADDIGLVLAECVFDVSPVRKCFRPKQFDEIILLLEVTVETMFPFALDRPDFSWDNADCNTVKSILYFWLGNGPVYETVDVGRESERR